MTDEPEQASASISGYRLVLLVLLVTSILVNYIDRGALSVAIGDIETEFSLTPSQKGLLLSVFFWTYALMQLPAGWLVDRYDVKWVYAGGFLIWTIATALTGFVGGFVSLIAVRLLLGLGESAAYPAISRLVVENYREEQRGTVNSLIDAGTKIGPAFSILVGGLLVDQFGWRALFITLGIGSLVWLVPWIKMIPSRSPQDHAAGAQPAGRPRIRQVAMNRSVWGSSLGMFSLGYVWYFLLTWLPSYLMDVHGLNLKETAVLAALPFLAMAMSSVFWGWAADRLIRSGRSPTLARKSIALCGLGIAAVLLVAATKVVSASMCIALLAASCAALGMFTANVWAMTQTMAGPAAGSWTGIQNCVGNMGGVLSPLVAGWSVEQTGSYQTAFYCAAGVVMLGIVAYLFLVGPIQEIKWQENP
ncbi:putative galactarate transporter [Rubripirellula lacrimiformis]|uniref:Putative galactarate transporter n=1 Tax=Rubripirellula lacrimiformis TaxID=1930273 RepID=A0A517NCM8_9BACT|nr:MFS transporter [Rubripirellula lacrimiformis]QDT04808.1 putative galactarate transporter [Rubripirellula lacrimiformis]